MPINNFVTFKKILMLKYFKIFINNYIFALIRNIFTKAISIAIYSSFGHL